MAKDVSLNKYDDIINMTGDQVTNRNSGAGIARGKTKRKWLQGQNDDGTYGNVNWLGGDEEKFREIQNEFFNDFPELDYNFDPGNPEHVGLFQNWHNQRAAELGQEPYFKGNTKTGAGGFSTDNKFGDHTLNAWDISSKTLDLPKVPLEPPPLEVDMSVLDEKPIERPAPMKPYEPTYKGDLTHSNIDPTRVEPQRDTLYIRKKTPPEYTPEIKIPEDPPKQQSYIVGDKIGNSIADLALGALGGYFSDHGDKWKMYRGKFGEEALNKAVGYRSELEAKNAMNPYETASQMRDVDLAQQGALLSAQRNMVNKNTGTQGDVGGNLGTGAALAAAYGATSPYVQQKAQIQQQGLQRGDQLTQQTNALNDQIAHTEYDITDFRDHSKNYMKMLEQGLNTYNKVKDLYGNKPQTIYEDNRNRTGK